MTAEQAYAALNSPYLNNNEIYIQPEELGDAEPVYAHGGWWLTCRVHVPDKTVQDAIKSAPHIE